MDDFYKLTSRIKKEKKWNHRKCVNPVESGIIDGLSIKTTNEKRQVENRQIKKNDF